MRIVAGEWAGKPLTSPSGRVRPTGEALRTSAMELLGAELKGARVLDLFAGTGALGLEALSRGAASCDFVEDHPSALHALKANVARMRARQRARIFKQDALRFAGRLPAGSYDIAIADPPYRSRQLDRLLEGWRARPFARLLLMEHAHDHELPARGRSRRVENSVVTLLKASGNPGPRPSAAR